MKWDDDAEFDDIDEDDKHAFESLRKVSFSPRFYLKRYVNSWIRVISE